MASEKVKTFTDSNFDTEIKNGVTLVDFWAEWCGPCKMFAPVLDEVAKTYQGKLTVAKLDIDANPATPGRYGIRGIPTVILYKGGQVHAQKVGALTKSQQVKTLVPLRDAGEYTIEVRDATSDLGGADFCFRVQIRAQVPHVGNVRQRGLMVGIELVSDRESNEPFDWRERTGQRVCHRARELGMLTRPLGDVVVFMPPLVTERDDLEAMVGILELAIMDVTGA